MRQTTGFYPRVRVDASGSAAVGQAGGVLLTGAVRASGLDAALSGASAPWRKPLAVHDPAKVVLDLALSPAVGGDCLADVGLLRAEPGVYGRVASDPTLSRAIDAPVADAPAALAAIDTARAAARARVWGLVGQHAPDHEVDAASPVVIDLDATPVGSHSEKENAAPTFKRGFGFHPLCAFVDQGAEGTGEPLAMALRAGNAGSNTATRTAASPPAQTSSSGSPKSSTSPPTTYSSTTHPDAQTAAAKTPSAPAWPPSPNSTTTTSPSSPASSTPS